MSQSSKTVVEAFFNAFGAGNIEALLNCLHEKGFYTEERVRAAEGLKLPGAVCMLLHGRWRSED